MKRFTQNTIDLLNILKKTHKFSYFAEINEVTYTACYELCGHSFLSSEKIIDEDSLSISIYFFKTHDKLYDYCGYVRTSDAYTQEDESLSNVKFLSEDDILHHHAEYVLYMFKSRNDMIMHKLKEP